MEKRQNVLEVVVSILVLTDNKQWYLRRYLLQYTYIAFVYPFPSLECLIRRIVSTALAQLRGRSQPPLSGEY